MPRGRHAKKIDSVHWTYGSFSFPAQAAGVIAANMFSAQHLPETLIRFRGEWVAAFSSPTADAIGAAISIGMIQVPEGTGTTVLWSPVTDGDAPWIWWDVFHLVYQENVTDAIASQVTNSARRVIDSKAMRKLRNTELQVVVEQTTLLSAGSTDIFGSGRVLTGS